MSEPTLFDPNYALKPWQRRDTPRSRLKRIAPEDAFDGSTYEPDKDFERLGAQMQRVWDALKDGRWWTLARLSDVTGDPEASVSARLRDLRKRKFGGYVVERRRVGGGLFEYRLVQTDERAA